MERWTAADAVGTKVLGMRPLRNYGASRNRWRPPKFNFLKLSAELNSMGSASKGLGEQSRRLDGRRVAAIDN